MREIGARKAAGASVRVFVSKEISVAGAFSLVMVGDLPAPDAGEKLIESITPAMDKFSQSYGFSVNRFSTLSVRVGCTGYPDNLNVMDDLAASIRRNIALKLKKWEWSILVDFVERG